jgi:hypothetical protein
MLAWRLSPADTGDNSAMQTLLEILLLPVRLVGSLLQAIGSVFRRA